MGLTGFEQFLLKTYNDDVKHGLGVMAWREVSEEQFSVSIKEGPRKLCVYKVCVCFMHTQKLHVGT